MSEDNLTNKVKERNKKVEDLKFKITELINKNKRGNFNADLGDFDFMVDEIQQLITKTNVKLWTSELRSICNIFFCMEKSKDRDKQTHRLNQADKLFAEIDHTNSGIIETKESTIGLFYEGVAKDSKYQCQEWAKLILKSIEDLDDRNIRQKIIQHPFDCDHPICKQVASHMKEITGGKSN